MAENRENQSSLQITGARKRSERADLKISVGQPQWGATEYFVVLNIEGVIDQKKIYADDPISALINALGVIKSVLDPPIPAIASELSEGLNVLQVINIDFKG